QRHPRRRQPPDQSAGGFLGVQLFHRLTREVQLTSEATELASKLTQALDLMAEATISLSGLNTLDAAENFGGAVLRQPSAFAANW
ncbi:MAG: hypothetical protein ACU0C9_00445, partial [Paracoccaceae bacterium]